MFQEFNNICIESIASCVPDNKIDNTYFLPLLSEKELKVFEKTVGIKSRRWANDGVTAADLGFEAAQSLLKETASTKVRALIFLSQTADYKIPFTSNILQSRLGLDREMMCLDINAGCAGFIQGLCVAYSIAQTLTDEESVLLIIGETLSKILSPHDRSTNMLFGDAASAILISKNSKSGKSYFNFYSDGANFDAIIIPQGGYRKGICFDSFKKKNKGAYENEDLYLKMDGSRVFDFTLREVAPSIKSLLSKAQVEQTGDVSGFFFHQSNHFIIKQIAAMLGADIGKVPTNIDEFGNTSGVSIPLLLNTNINKLASRDRILCSGYGSGLNWGNCLLDLSLTRFIHLKEI